MRKRHIAVLAAFALAISIGNVALAHDPPDGVNEQQNPGRHNPHDGIVDTALEAHLRAEAQHGPTSDHVIDPSVTHDVDLVGRFNVPRSKGSQAGIVTDVWSMGTTAYLGTFAPPCAALGVNVVDISDPSDPTKLTFIPSRPGTRVNDVKVFSFSGLASGFSGDLLLHSNENCSGNPQRVGGISIYDVSDPANPVRLAVGVGDKSTDNTAGLVDRARARQVHNIYAWQDGDRAYAGIVDDEEVTDLDILDITDPRNPVHIADVGLPDWPAATVDAFGDEAFHHDLWAKQIEGRWTLLLSYWDAGWILLDVEDTPWAPVFLGDSDYPTPDPLVQARLGFDTEPDGAAHAGVWNNTGELLLTGDEDIEATRLTFEVTEGPGAGLWDAGEFAWTKPISTFPDGRINGPIVFGGYGCPDDRGEIPEAMDVFPTVEDGEERIVVFQRGPVDDPNDTSEACFFSEKVESGELAGYDAVIIANHHVGSGAGAQPDGFICGSQGSPVAGTAAGLCIGHRFMHEAFDRTADYTVPYPMGDPGDLEPNIGDLGGKIDVTSEFNGWGPFHLINGTTLEEVDAWAPPQTHDPEFATGHGWQTMHNVEADPNGDLAYIAWYALGFRVLDFSECDPMSDGNSDNQDDPGCITEAGAFLDDRGNDFWGVHVASDHPMSSADDPLILASDRDSGLWIFRYTGPRP